MPAHQLRVVTQRHRRRVRAEGAGVPRGRRAGRGQQIARPAGEVDRGPQRAPDGLGAGPRGGCRARGGGRRTTARCSACASTMTMNQGAYPRLPFPSATVRRDRRGVMLPGAYRLQALEFDYDRCRHQQGDVRAPTAGRGRSRPGSASGCSTSSPASSASTPSTVRRRTCSPPSELPTPMITGPTLAAA